MVAALRAVTAGCACVAKTVPRRRRWPTASWTNSRWPIGPERFGVPQALPLLVREEPQGLPPVPELPLELPGWAEPRRLWVPTPVLADQLREPRNSGRTDHWRTRTNVGIEAIGLPLTW
jgi:hypothetical protein